MTETTPASKMMETQRRRDAEEMRGRYPFAFGKPPAYLPFASSSASPRLRVSKAKPAGSSHHFQIASRSDIGPRHTLFTALLLLALSFFTAISAHAQQLSTDDEKALLTKLREQRSQFPALTADFTEERTTHLLNKPIHGTGTIAFHAPGKFRRELKGTSPSLTICNGTDLWIHYPAFSAAEHYTLGKKQFFDDSLAALTAGLNFQDVEKFFRIAPAREGTGYRIVLTPKSSGVRRFLTTLTVWMNAEAVIEKTDATLPKGDRITTTYRNVRPQKSVEAKFDFTPPAGTHISTPLGN